MGKELQEDYNVIKSFNNNIVLVENKGKEMILFGKGIGFNKKNGQTITKNTIVDKIFSIQQEENVQNFNKVIEGNDKEFLALCEELICYIAFELKEELNERIHINLIDHLSFTMKRLKNNESIDNPFLFEIESLYPKEFKLAEEIIKKIEKKYNLNIPYGEIGFIAVHIHSARNNGKVANSIKYSYIVNTAVEIIEDYFNIEINRKSLDYARFATHLKFAVKRMKDNKIIKNDLLDIIIEKYSQSYYVAVEIAAMIVEELELDVASDEIGYIAIHIERLRASSN
ncbi:PRD domain-containing protein [Clostridium tarantellae]|uniref:PRD domain-containing protein n=1 Tax=Clostridium tarantellae TaxID=39493 RepID=A0A6I1MWE3_9CLOT|nr:PRD domain-containing protein [Clostridium tarantellae]MPQ44489.1 PRD domain-containing protein [Clostridium tarantellae]